jgi:hypothetical protein
MALPLIDVEITQENGCTGSECCIVIGQEFTITPTYTLNLEATVCLTSTLLYELYNHEGDLIDSLEYSITNASPEDPSVLLYTYTPTEVGDLRLVTTLTNCVASASAETTIRACDYIKVSKNSCHGYTVENCSLTDTIKVTFETKAGVIIGEELVEVDAATTLDLTSTGDGIFYIHVYDEDDELIQTYIIIDYCDIEICLSSKIMTVLCSDCDTDVCKDYCRNRHDLNKIGILAFLFFNKVNKEYSLNRIYSSINDAKVSELDNLQTVIDQLTNFCEACTSSLGTSQSTIAQTSSEDCGCE